MKKLFVTAIAVLIAAPCWATCVLRQSDAVEVPIGQFVDATDGVTAETGLTISQADVQLKKCAAAGDCGAMAQKNDSGACAHDALGVYECDLDATDTNTVGMLFIYVNESGALTERLVCEVVEEAVYDKDYGASATGIIGSAQTGDSFSRLGAPVGASMSADVAAVKTQTAAIEADTQDIQSRLPAALVGGRMPSDVGSVSGDSAVADRLEALLDHTCGAYEEFGIARGGCAAQAATSTTIQLDASASFANDSVVGMQVLACGSTQGYCQTRAITDYVSSTDTATVSDWNVTPSGTITYWLFGSAPIDAISANVVSIEGTDATDYLDTELQPVNDLLTYVGTPDDFGSGASLSDNLADIEAQTDDIGAAGAGLTAADNAVVALLGTPAGASLAADVAAVESQTDDIGVAGAGLTAVDDATLTAIAALNDISIADIEGIVIEDQSGNQIDLKCALRAITAYVGGDLSTSSGTSTYEDATGTDPLIVAVITGTAGNRNGTISCATTP